MKPNSPSGFFSSALLLSVVFAAASGITQAENPTQHVASLSPAHTLKTPAPGQHALLDRLTPSTVFMTPTVEDPVGLAILAARQAMQAGKLADFEAAAQHVPRGHVLSSYLDYWRLRLQLQTPQLSDEDYQRISRQTHQYIKTYPKSLATDLLRRDWMLAAGRRQDWPVIDAMFPQWVLQDESAPYCLASLSALAKVPEGKKPSAAVLKTATKQILTPKSLNAACTPLLNTLAERQWLNRQQRQTRLNLALEINATADIRQAVKLQPGTPLSGKPLDLALNKPAAALKKPISALQEKIALVRLARQDPAKAATQLQRSKRLGKADREFVWSQIAAVGAQRLDPKAVQWARHARHAAISDHTRVWLARAALAAQDWRLLEQIVQDMGSSLRQSPTWVYWQGRAHLAQGKKVKAHRAFESLAGRHDYYGKLAREELGQPWLLPPTPKAPSEASIKALDRNLGIRQAMAFYQLGLRAEGNREWNYQMRGRSADGLRAAAVWATRHGLLDRAINADERIVETANYQLRFPTPFAEQLIPITAEQQIDPAWVYGLIRQESRFVMNARSHVGASGLMQIMPATAKWVAKQMGQNDYQQSQLNDLHTNLTFGSYYLRRALDNLDGSPVLASAGYNAGPRRAHAWRARLSRPLEGAIFTEIIPFSETRQYVKSVLSNTVDYAGLFTGKPQSLKTWLSEVKPQADGGTAIP
ncbi:MAG: transglycosylase SLT domain-containing protein [Lautropia sp.]|nr:transglycosylase SLT domain-containing protein [Lautropia sp.]